MADQAVLFGAEGDVPQSTLPSELARDERAAIRRKADGPQMRPVSVQRPENSPDCRSQSFAVLS